MGASVWQFMMQQIPELVADSIMQLTEVGLTHREAEQELRQASTLLARTLATHFRQDPVCKQAFHGPKASIEGLLDIEESIWAPRYGLKGVIDATIISRIPQQAETDDPDDRGNTCNVGVAALEFKSGKAYHTHAAQLGIYGLLLHSRYGFNPGSGLLWYSRLQDMDLVSLEAASVAGMSGKFLHKGLASKNLCVLPPTS